MCSTLYIHLKAFRHTQPQMLSKRLTSQAISTSLAVCIAESETQDCMLYKIICTAQFAIIA